MTITQEYLVLKKTLSVTPWFKKNMIIKLNQRKCKQGKNNKIGECSTKSLKL